MYYSNLPEIDLHGMERDIAVVSVKDFITDSIKQKNFDILIIHGIGTGILKKAVHQYLKTDQRVIEYKLDFMNPGCTMVKLKKNLTK